MYLGFYDLAKMGLTIFLHMLITINHILGCQKMYHLIIVLK